MDDLADAREKKLLEMLIRRSLRDVEVRKPIDIVVLDVRSLEENIKPGALASGLILGFRKIHDEIGVEELVWRAIEEAAEEDFAILKAGKRLNVSLLARAKLKSRIFHNEKSKS